MPAGLILAIDQGTTNTKALLVGRDGTPLFRTSTSLPLIVTESGLVEQDALRLWDSVRHSIAECISYAAETGAIIDAIAISNQRETAVAWNAESGSACGQRVISWQM